MATGFPAATGDVLSAAMFNGLVTYTINTQTGTTYTLASTDQYQASGTTTVTSAGAVSAAPTIAQYKAAVCVKTGTDAWTVIGAVS